jgi:uncharacterized protein YbbC (DUF1343 family)
MFFTFSSCKSQNKHNEIIVGADRTDAYFPFIGNKNFAVVANHTSRIGSTHLVDSIVQLPMNLKKIFSPEHGFRGKADAGAHIKNGKDAKTGIPVISLYGNHKKPTARDLEGIEIVLFDIQDVGARFYTYISTLTLVMEACAENNIPLVVLDRPNPNGHYVDGPVLEYGFESFVGMHRIPVVHGMTMAEYARMVNGEGWLKNAIQCDLIWVKCENYNHKTPYTLPVKPSPNLPDMESIGLYPSLCLFEGTVVSIGRGTDFPFTVYGHPRLMGTYSFTPHPKEGASKPKLSGEICYGEDLRMESNLNRVELKWLIDAYMQYPDKDNFFNSYFDKLAGSDALRKAIINKKSESEIRKSWEMDLNEFKRIRKSYLLYPDFE